MTSRWHAQLQDHAVHESLRLARDLARTAHKDPVGEVEAERLRFLKILDLIESVIASLDADLTPLNVLDNLNGTLRNANVWNSLVAFAKDGQSAHLQNANDHVSALLPLLPQLSTYATTLDEQKRLSTLDQIAISFSDTLAAASSKLTQMLGALENDAGDLKAKIDALETQVSTSDQTAQQQLSAWQTQFSEAETQRRADYEAWSKSSMATFVDQTTKIAEESEAKLASQNQKYAKSVERLLGDAHAKHQEILELHEIVAGDSVAAGYMQSAQDERGAANFWRWASVIFIVTTVLWGVYSYLGSSTGSEQDLSFWATSLKAFSVAGVLLFGAVYSSKQSNLHRKNERQARWLALEVKAIDPFIASLSANEQADLKKQLSEKLFGNSQSQLGADEHAISEDLLSMVMKHAESLVKAVK